MNVRCSALRRGRTRRLALLGALSLLVLSIPLVLAAPAGAAALTGGFGPTIVNGGADLNGDGAVTGSDDANEFYGSTHIIDGHLDCDTWERKPMPVPPVAARSRARMTASSSAMTARRTA
jgi:hypothetical protein